MKTSRLLLPTIGGVLASLALAACGGATTGATSTPTPTTRSESGSTTSTPGGILNGGTGGAALDACTVVSAADASKIVGVTVTKLTGQSAGAVSECSYIDTAGGGAAVTVIIETIPGVSMQVAMQAAMAQASKGTNNGNQPVSGIGDQAFKEVQDHGSTLVFVKSNTLVAIGASGSTRTGTAIEGDLETLGKKLAGKI
jgi:hypothetical protein